MVKYKVIFDRKKCIGALVCNSIAPKFWKIANDGKVDLIKSKLNKKTGYYELIVDEGDFELNNTSVDGCPVNAIQIEKL